jgi:hypothetical protein
VQHTADFMQNINPLALNIIIYSSECDVKTAELHIFVAALMHPQFKFQSSADHSGILFWHQRVKAE